MIKQVPIYKFSWSKMKWEIQGFRVARKSNRFPRIPSLSEFSRPLLLTSCFICGKDHNGMQCPDTMFRSISYGFPQKHQFGLTTWAE